MTESVNFDPGMMAGSEVMEVMMTGGDGGEMNEDTLAQVVSMLQNNGQLTGANQTIIIRQPGSDEIQMIQPSSNGQEFAVSKLSEADLQALQSTNGVLDQGLLESNDQGQVVMMDDGGNLVEGVVQMQDGNVASDGGVLQLPTDGTSAVLQEGKVVSEAADILANFNDIQGLDAHNMINSVMKSSEMNTVSANKPITISSSMNPMPAKAKRSTIVSNGDVVSIKINTGIKPKPVYCTPNAIKISTVTGQQKYQPPKFHKCESCSINFVSKIAFMNHMENCPNSKRKLATPLSSKSNITYSCVFCETKFNSRLVLMQHVRTCDKAKSSKNVMNQSAKLKVTTSESRLGEFGAKRGGKNNRRVTGGKVRPFGGKRKESFLDPDDPGYAKEEEESCSEEERNIPYDDDEDLNDEDLRADDEPLSDSSRRSQKHLGPIVGKGSFQCRDCSRTFSKENQYNRHVKGCSSTPLNTTKIINDNAGPQQQFMSSVVPVNAMDAAYAQLGGKRKRMNDFDFVNKKRALGTPLNKGKKHSLDMSDNDSGEDIADFFEKRGVDDRNPSSIRSSINKIVKISPSDKLVKKTGKAILSKMKNRRLARDLAVCGLCGDKFPASGDLSAHAQIAHSEELLQVRDVLDGKGPAGGLKCALCDMHFAAPKALISHMVVSHNNELRTIQDELDYQNVSLCCPFCPDTCYSQDLLREHVASTHLDKLTSKPIGQTCPAPIDVVSLLREKNNGSMENEKLLGSRQKTMACPDCALVYPKASFQQHKCASVNLTISAKKFVCSEPQCTSLGFYKLVHLLTHLKQAHENLSETSTETFDTHSQFLEWLKKEESQSKMKFTKAFQRMKNGMMLSVWICHRFHNAMKDNVANSLGINDIDKCDRLNQCYARMYAETKINKSTSRYDGETHIQYYSQHKHPVVKVAAPQLAVKESLLKSIKKGNEVPCKSPSPKPPTEEPQKPETPPVETAEPEPPKEIPQVESPKPAEVEAFPPPEVQQEPPLEEQLSELAKESALPSPPALPPPPPVPSLPQETSFSDAAELRQLLEGDDDFDGSKKPLDSFDENPLADLAVLEPPPKAPSEAPPSEEEEEEESEEKPMEGVEFEAPSSPVPVPTPVPAPEDDKSNILSEEPVEAPKEEDSSSSEVVKDNLFNDDDLLLEKMLQETTPASKEETEDLELCDKDESDGDEESTYVLPADIAEWNKLFELVRSQVSADSLSAPERQEAERLLTFDDRILDVAIETQVQVFNSLCSLANVQMT